MDKLVMNKNKRNGFTLVELLIVLLIVSIVTIFILPSMFKTITKQETNHFFETFSSDVLYIQNKSLYTDEALRIFPRKTHYYILSPKDEPIIREFPHELYLINHQSPQIFFSTNGTVQHPNTYSFKDGNELYRIVFPFGKGRHYIEGM